jgi:hypothetical protein
VAKKIANRRALIDYYKMAKFKIECSPYVQEIKWQQALRLSNISETHFLREYAWVVLNSGFREAVVRRHFDYISLCFCDWESAEAISSNARACVESALAAFANRRKLEAIVNTAGMVSAIGFELLKLDLERDPLSVLSPLPFLGPVTKWHLAKNLGLDVAKPDRHLARLARQFGYNDVTRMCGDIGREFGDRIAVVDSVLWRFEEQFRSQVRT